MEGLPGLVLVWCLIGFSHANFSPTINNRIYEVCEDAPIGANVFTVSATDNEDDPMTYSLAAPNDGFFTIDANTGGVTVSRLLDREDEPTIELGVRVSDPYSGTSATLIIILNEANDNRPIFEKSSYDVTIPESTAVGATLFRALATDQDTSPGSDVFYSIDEVTPKSGLGLFKISPLGDVILMGPLNFTSLSSFYQLKINATDGGDKCYYDTVNHFSSVVFSFITVEDVPDLDPLFVGVPYVGSVKENSAPGWPVLVVTALDQDKGVADDIIYSIEGSSAEGLFDVSPTTGAITVKENIDREVIGDSVTLTVKATEANVNVHGAQAIATATVRISIIDLNDNSPKFYRCGAECVEESSFTGEVVEHLLGAVSFNMTVKDLDQMKRVSLRLEGEYQNVFSVQPPVATSDSAVQLQVLEPQLLDYEEVTQMVLKVIAQDLDHPSFQATATVTINIQDANDQSPAFPHGSYRLSVPENSAEGTVLDTLTAKDTDTMDQGNITYSLLPDSIRLYFDVEPLKGVVYVKNATLLDREVRSLFSATLQARDTGNKPGSTLLEITVTDVNDHAPVINRGFYREFVKEGEPLEVKIEATDADDSETENSQIVFGILPSAFSGNFTIDPDTGVLRNKGELDREAMDPELKGIIELNVNATDKGAPPLSSAVNVTIVVEDVDDNTPEFKESSYTFYVKEGEKGVFVGSVQAEDKDQEFDRISFSILEGSFGSFIIRSYEDERGGGGYLGNITVDPEIELDYESEHKVFALEVEAADLGQNTAGMTVKVVVLDVNDERPVFRPPTPVTATVKEDGAPGEVVGRFGAEDSDGNHSLVFRLESLRCRCNGSMEACGGFVLDPTGEVRIDPELTLDYELCDLALMEARVADEYTEKGENSSAAAGVMEINIEDVNDNAPQFIVSDSVFVVVSERASKGMPVARVTATDRDSGVNRQIDFKVTGVEFRDINNQTKPMKALFDAVTTQQKDIYVGIIQTTGKLEKSLKGKYLVAVSATDPGDLSSNTVLEIFAVDESYQVSLVFTKSKSYVEANLNKIVGRLMAATLAVVEIASIGDDDAEPSRASVSTVVVAYFIYSNGTVLTSTQVEKMISVPQHSLGLIELGLADIGKIPTVVEPVDTLKYGLLGMVAGLIVVLSVLVTSLVCTRRSFKRKLKAAKAMNSASMVTSDNQKSGPVVPGTNKYTMEGANPVLNLNMDAVMHLDLDGESSDVDKVSLNSLDSSGYMDSHENGVLMNVIEEEEEEEEGGPPVYIEPLGAALAQRGPKKGRDNPLLGVSNPAFSTTDL